jgi:signal peptidase I
MAETVVMTLAVFLFLVTFVVQGYKVYGSCMEPNLHTGERLLGNKFIYRFDKPTRGDIIVFRYPLDPRKVFIKRVIGLPGETVAIRGDKVYINGRALNERYVRDCSCDDFPSQKVPPGHIFVLGDNRDQSNDSRFWGELPMKNIKAKAWLRYWPISKIAVF